MTRINPQALRHFRDKQNLSQDDLSRRSGVDKGTIFRIEAGRMRRNGERVITRLAKHLKVEIEQLTATHWEEGPSPPDSMTLFPKTQLNVRVAPEVRNALALVGQRYGVSVNDVVEFAPFLFHLVASESLISRSERLAELRTARDAVSELSGQFKHLTERMLNDWQADEIENLEERSIEKRDLRGSTIDEADPFTDARPLDYDEDETNPFVVHLRERLTAIQADASSDRLEGWFGYMGVRYEICREQALAWFGGDEDAADDLLAGRFSITDVPKDIRASGFSGRVAWAKTKRDELDARSSEYLSVLGLGDLL